MGTVILVRRAAAVLGLALACTSLVVPPASADDDVSTARAQLSSLQDLARTTTATLVEGTRRWQEDQDRLAAYTLQLQNTRRRVAALQVEVQQQQATVDTALRQVFMHGGRSALDLSFTQRPAEVLDVLSAQHSLDLVTGSTSAVIARAATTRLHLRAQEQDAADLVARAAALTAASAKRLASLNALADRTALRLTAAQAQLDQALRRQAAREAAARAAAARAARAARVRLARARVVGSSGAFCTSTSTAGQANGNLDPSSLCPLWQAPGHRLRSDAAKAFNALTQYYARTVGSPLCVTDSYRSYADQVSVYRRKPGLAAVPGTSEHGWGKAVDLCGGVETWGSAEQGWMQANAGRFGWSNPDWAAQSGSRPEAWHWEYAG